MCASTPAPQKSKNPKKTLSASVLPASSGPARGVSEAALARPLGHICTNSDITAANPCIAPSPRAKNDQRKAAAWERDELAKALAGVSPETSDDDINVVIRDQHTTIQRYIAALGYGAIRKRMGGAGNVSDNDIIGYEAGFGAAALCGHLPIPSSGIDGDGARYSTGASGAMEIYYQSPPEILRPKITVSDFRAVDKSTDAPKVHKRNMARCRSRKCLDCTIKQADQDANDLQWGLAMLLFKGMSYIHLTLTLRHFHKDARRQITALKTIWDKFQKTYVFKKVSKKYGIRVVYKHLELTLDSLISKRNSGAHPHYHIVLSCARKIYWGKKVGAITYAVPTEADVQDMQSQLAGGWYDCIKDYYDAEKMGWAEKYKDDILQHGIYMQLYPVDSAPQTWWGQAAREQWEAHNAIYTDYVQRVRDEWETDTYEMPEQCKKYKSYIDNIWQNNREHFYKQLAGLSNISSYTGGISKFDVFCEATQGATKQGQSDRRVSYFAWLYQAAHAHSDKIDRRAKELIRALYRLRFRVVGRVLKDVLNSDFVIFDENTKQICDIGLTMQEIEEESAYDKSDLLPRYLPGDEIRLAAYPFGGPDYMIAHRYGTDQALARVNDAILRLIKDKKPVSVDNVWSFWGATEKEMRDKTVHSYYNPMSDSVIYDYTDGAPAAGRSSPKIPDYILASACWDYADDCLKPQSRKYQNILRLCKQYAPAEYRYIVSTLLADADIAEQCTSAADLMDFEHYSRRAEQIILQMWADGGLKERMQDAAPVRRLLASPRADIAREQAQEERMAIAAMLAGNDDYTARDISVYMDTAQYTGVWDDVYGVYTVHRVSSAGLCKRVVRIDDCISISRAALEIGYGWCIGPAAPPVSGLQSMSGWWGTGYNLDAFDLDRAGRQAAILGASFDILPRPDYVDGVEIWGRGRGEYAGCVLAYTPGRLSALLLRRRAEKAARLRDAADAALRDVQDTARRVGWRRKDIKDNRDLMRILARAVATCGISADTVADALINSRDNYKRRKSKTRLISRLERDLAWRKHWDGIASVIDTVCADYDTAMDWIVPRWSAVEHARTGQYIDARPAPTGLAVEQGNLPGLAG